MQKVLFIIPGFGETPKDPPYKKITDMAIKAGYVPQIIPIHWNYRAMSQYIEQARSIIGKTKSDDISILGFSFGAFIAFEISKNIRCKKLFLCSLSPFFKEDLSSVTPTAKYFLGKRRMLDFKQYQFPKKTSCFSYFLFGEKEWDASLKKMETRLKKLSGEKRLLFVENTSHDIRTPEYLNKIKEIL